MLLELLGVTLSGGWIAFTCLLSAMLGFVFRDSLKK